MQCAKYLLVPPGSSVILFVTSCHTPNPEEHAHSVMFSFYERIVSFLAWVGYVCC